MIDDPDDYTRNYRIEDGRHCFHTGIADEWITLNHALTAMQIETLARNPALVRCCLIQASFNMAWLDDLLASVAMIDAAGASERTLH